MLIEIKIEIPEDRRKRGYIAYDSRYSAERIIEALQDAIDELEKRR